MNEHIFHVIKRIIQMTFLLYRGTHLNIDYKYNNKIKFTVTFQKVVQNLTC